MSATIHSLPVPGLHDIPEMLRRVAEAIEDGQYGNVGEAVLEVFGWGTADATATYYMIGRAQRKMERIDLL